MKPYLSLNKFLVSSFKLKDKFIKKVVVPINFHNIVQEFRIIKL